MTIDSEKFNTVKELRAAISDIVDLIHVAKLVLGSEVQVNGTCEGSKSDGEGISSAMCLLRLPVVYNKFSFGLS